MTKMWGELMVDWVTASVFAGIVLFLVLLTFYMNWRYNLKWRGKKGVTLTPKNGNGHGLD
jgi:hypothetical protein